MSSPSARRHIAVVNIDKKALVLPELFTIFHASKLQLHEHKTADGRVAKRSRDLIIGFRFEIGPHSASVRASLKTGRGSLLPTVIEYALRGRNGRGVRLSAREFATIFRLLMP